MISIGNHQRCMAWNEIKGNYTSKKAVINGGMNLKVVLMLVLNYNTNR